MSTWNYRVHNGCWIVTWWVLYKEKKSLIYCHFHEHLAFFSVAMVTEKVTDICSNAMDQKHWSKRLAVGKKNRSIVHDMKKQNMLIAFYLLFWLDIWIKFMCSVCPNLQQSFQSCFIQLSMSLWLVNQRHLPIWTKRLVFKSSSPPLFLFVTLLLFRNVNYCQQDLT